MSAGVDSLEASTQDVTDADLPPHPSGGVPNRSPWDLRDQRLGFYDVLWTSGYELPLRDQVMNGRA